MSSGSHTDPAAASADGGADGEADAPLRSLLGDVEALIDDGKTWFAAEVNYQKSRAGYVAGRVKLLVGLGLGVLFFLIMALFALVVGLTLALTPLITAWGAMAVVVGGLVLGAAAMGFGLLAVWRKMMAEIKDETNG